MILATILIIFGIVGLDARPPLKGHGTCREPIDLVFVLDSSSSIWKPNFVKQLHFVGDIASKFNVGQGSRQTRIGVATFSDYAHVQMHLNEHKNVQTLKRALTRVLYLQGGTNTAGAINLARNTMFTREHGARDGVRKIAVVVTDGQSRNTDHTRREAAILKGDNVTVFAIGVGSAVDVAELSSIATYPPSRFVYNVTDYDALSAIIKSFGSETCHVAIQTTTVTEATTASSTTTEQTTAAPTTSTTDAPTKTERTTTEPTTTTNTPIAKKPLNDQKMTTQCDKVKGVDLYFVLDSSTSIWIQDFKTQLTFVKTVVSYFDVNSTRVGLSTFSDLVHPVIKIGEFRDENQLAAAIDKVEYKRGLTYTGDAIAHMRKEMVAASKDDRVKIAVVITDGISRQPQKTIEESKLAHDAGIIVYAIGVGRNMDKAELEHIASDPDDEFVFTVDNYDSLDSIKEKLAIKSCDVTRPDLKFLNESALECKERGSDITFIVDSSHFTGRQISDIISFIRTFVTKVFIGLGGVRVTVLRDNCAEKSVRITNNYETDKLLPITTSTPSMVSHLDSINVKSRPGVAVLFVADEIQYHKSIVAAAMSAQKRGVEIYTVAIGGRVMESQLMDIVSVPFDDHIMYIKNYDKLASFVHTFVSILCN